MTKEGNLLLYVRQPTGTGKSHSMVELGHDLAMDMLKPTGTKAVSVWLVVMSEDMIPHYQKKFAEKKVQADPRVNFIF